MKTNPAAHRIAASCRALSAFSLLLLAGCSSSSGSAQGPEGISVSPASEARQGQGAITLSFEQAAGGLSSPTNVTLGDLTVAVDPKSTDQRLLLTVTVPHGAMPGPRTLSFDTASGSSTHDNAITVTPITVGAAGQDSNLGTTSAPFRTLKQALLVAGPGDTCLLGAGSYDAKSGETWGYAIPDQLTIVGDGAATTVLTGPITSKAPDSAAANPPPPVVALQPASGLALQNLTLLDFDVAVDLAQPAQLSLQDVAVQGFGIGVSAEADGSTLTLNGGTIDTGGFGIEIGGTCNGCTLSIVGTALSESGDGALLHVDDTTQNTALTLHDATLKGGMFVADPTATLTIDGSSLTGNGSNVALNFGGAKLDVTSSTFVAGASPYGIGMRSGQMSLTDVTVQGNEYCVYQLAGTSKVRGTKLNGYSSIGFYYASGSLDLGTATDAGNNAFAAASSPGPFALYVDTDTQPLTCSNTSFNGIVPPPSTVQANATDTITVPDDYIVVPGREITFYVVK